MRGMWILTPRLIKETHTLDCFYSRRFGVLDKLPEDEVILKCLAEISILSQFASGTATEQSISTFVETTEFKFILSSRGKLLVVVCVEIPNITEFLSSTLSALDFASSLLTFLPSVSLSSPLSDSSLHSINHFISSQTKFGRFVPLPSQITPSTQKDLQLTNQIHSRQIQDNGSFHGSSLCSVLAKGAKGNATLTFRGIPKQSKAMFACPQSMHRQQKTVLPVYFSGQPICHLPLDHFQHSVHATLSTKLSTNGILFVTIELTCTLHQLQNLRYSLSTSNFAYDDVNIAPGSPGNFKIDSQSVSWSTTELFSFVKHDIRIHLYPNSTPTSLNLSVEFEGVLQENPWKISVESGSVQGEFLSVRNDKTISRGELCLFNSDIKSVPGEAY